MKERKQISIVLSLCFKMFCRILNIGCWQRGDVKVTFYLKSLNLKLFNLKTSYQSAFNQFPSGKIAVIVVLKPVSVSVTAVLLML